LHYTTSGIAPCRCSALLRYTPCTTPRFTTAHARCSPPSITEGPGTRCSDGRFALLCCFTGGGGQRVRQKKAAHPHNIVRWLLPRSTLPLRSPLTDVQPLTFTPPNVYQLPHIYTAVGLRYAFTLPLRVAFYTPVWTLADCHRSLFIPERYLVSVLLRLLNVTFATHALPHTRYRRTPPLRCGPYDGANDPMTRYLSTTQQFYSVRTAFLRTHCDGGGPLFLRATTHTPFFGRAPLPGLVHCSDV